MGVESLWKSVLGEIEIDVSRATFASFFRGTRAEMSEKDDLITILCPNTASLHMLQNRYAQLIKSRLEERLNRSIRVRFRTLIQEEPVSVESGPLFSTVSATEKKVQSYGLNPHYAFDNFAVSESNQMAFAAAQAVANKPGKAYNPLFLWGSVGVGKTHLMQAIARHALSRDNKLKLMYCTGEEFTNEIVEAIRARATAAFKRKYRGAGLLLVDDIQFIAGREVVQMEFFHTFNSIVQAGGQVVLASDNPPSKIDALEARLRSRFEGGLTIDISPPNFELRTAILLIKAGERGVDLPIEAAKQLSATIEDTRALEGALLRFMTERQNELNPEKILKKMLGGRTDPNTEFKKDTDPQKIIELVAAHFDISVSQLLGKSRRRLIAEPRQVVMFLLRQELGLGFEEIGLLLGGRDHSTVMHGVEKISSVLPKRDALRQNVSRVRHLLWG